MGKRIVTINVARYYSKMTSVEIEVDEKLVDEDLIDYLTEDEALQEILEKAISQAFIERDDTTYEFQDTVNNFGGTL